MNSTNDMSDVLVAIRIDLKCESEDSVLFLTKTLKHVHVKPASFIDGNQGYLSGDHLFA